MERTDWDRLKELPPIGVIGVLGIIWVLIITELWMLWNWIGVPWGVTQPLGWWDMNWVWMFISCTGGFGRLIRGFILGTGLQGAPKKDEETGAPPS